MPKEKPLELVRIPLSQIKPDPKNAKDHDVGLIIESFKRFGYVNPMVLNSDDFLLAGHGRRKALLAMQGDGNPPPKNIEAKDDEWIVPVGVGPDFDQREGTAYRLVDNRSTEVGGYDEPQLLENLIALSKNGGLEGTGYDDEDVDRLFQLLNPDFEEVEARIDESALLQEKWGTEGGQLWEIGKHRLLCGDSTSLEDVGRLMDGDKAAMILTDPPYGMRLNADFSAMKNRLHFAQEKGIKHGRKYDNVIGDDKDFDATPIIEAWGNPPEQFWFGADYYASTLPDTEHSGSWLVWDKRLDESADRMFGSCFELIWSRKKRKRDMLRFKWAGIFGTEKEPQRGRQHPNQKPVALMSSLIRKANGVVSDPFLGSGTTMVAAEQLNRICYGMEISEKYTAVCLQRMADMGLTPKLVESAKG